MEEPAIRVLLVEDDEDDWIITRDLLSDIEEGRYHLDWVSTKEEGLEAILRGVHDIYILDYRLGSGSGLDLLQTALLGGCEAPMILLTGQGDREVDIEAMRLGAADYLVKGRVDSHILERSIRYSIQHARTMKALGESEERYALAARGANDGLWDWNLETDKVYFSPRWKSMLGFREEEIGDSPDEWFSRVHPEDLEGLRAEVEAHVKGVDLHLLKEPRMRHRDGTYRWMLIRGLAVRDASGKAYRIAGSLTDVTEQKVAEHQLLHDALHDALTGLPNRALLMEHLDLSIQRVKRNPQHLFAVLYLDIDRFKVINDSLGHVLGDALLVAIARRLEKTIFPGDTVARPGGDEFTLLLDDLKDISSATRCAKRIHRELKAPFHLEGHEIFVTASIGIALSLTGYDQAVDILRDADTAMYRAKAGGGARHVMFDQEMHARAVRQLELETDLRRAVEGDEFRLFYQPLIYFPTGRIVGFEALVRWMHPERGMLLPDEFIGLAEETRLILPIDQWVLGGACKQIRSWQQDFPIDPPLTISVNLSSLEFSHPRLLSMVESALDESGLEPGCLSLEITESTIMEHPETAVDILLELKRRGVGIHIDDFGTGYSSLSYLARYPIDSLKIDRSFVSVMGEGEDKLEIVRAIVTLAHNLKMNVMAEGVENREHLATLRDLDCEFGQGFLFSKPVPAEDIPDLLSQKMNW